MTSRICSSAVSTFTPLTPGIMLAGRTSSFVTILHLAVYRVQASLWSRCGNTAVAVCLAVAVAAAYEFTSVRIVPHPVLAGIVSNAVFQTLGPGIHICNSLDGYTALVVLLLCLAPGVVISDRYITWAVRSTMEGSKNPPRLVPFARSTSFGAGRPVSPLRNSAVFWAWFAGGAHSGFFYVVVVKVFAKATTVTTLYAMARFLLHYRCFCCIGAILAQLSTNIFTWAPGRP